MLELLEQKTGEWENHYIYINNDKMEILNLINLVIAMGIINVWIIRFDIQTNWRGGGAKSLKEEFLTYGLPLWFMYLVVWCW